MRLLTLVSVLAGSVIGCFTGGSAAWASATHMAKVDVELAWMSPGGRLESVVDRSLDFHLDWGTKKCEVEYKGVFYYCSLETGSDLKDRAGNVLMKELPVPNPITASFREPSSLEDILGWPTKTGKGREELPEC